MENPGLPDELWSELDGRLWHATDLQKLRGILHDEQIRPGIGNRYIKSLCRGLGGLCLFDFGPNSENIQPQFNNWSGWLGDQQDSRVPVWLEIERGFVREQLLDALATRQRCTAITKEWVCRGRIGELNAAIIPGVEACHLGPISIAAIAEVLLIDRHDYTVMKKLGRPNEETIARAIEFEAKLPPHEEDTLVKILRSARHRRRRT